MKNNIKPKYINAQKHRVYEIDHIIRFLKMIRGNGRFILIKSDKNND